MCRIQPSSVFLDYWTMSRMWLDLIVELESILADFFWKLVAHSVQNKVAWIFNLHPVVFSQFVSIISAVTLGLLVFPHIKKLHSRHTSWFSGRSAFQEGPKLSTKNTLLILNPQWMTNLGGLIQSLAMESPTIISRKANGPNAYNIFWKIQDKMAVQLEKASLLKPWDSLHLSRGRWFEKTEVDLERGESDLGETFLPQILAGYYTPTSAPTEVWLFGSSVKMGFGGEVVLAPKKALNEARGPKLLLTWKKTPFKLQTVWCSNKMVNVQENLPG